MASIGGWLRRRRARGVARATVAAATEGSIVRIVGEVVDTGGLLTAPLSGRRCAAYIATVRDLEQLHLGTLGHGAAHVAVTIDDGTGQASIDLDEVDLDLEASLRIDLTSPVVRGVTELMADAIRRGVLPRRDVETREWALAVGARVAVVGVAVRELGLDASRAGQAGYRGAPPTRLRLGAAPRRRPFLTDHPGVIAAP